MQRTHWEIHLIEDDLQIAARITNRGTGKNLDISVMKADFPDRDEAVGELFAGSLPNIRDSFDTV